MKFRKTAIMLRLVLFCGVSVLSSVQGQSWSSNYQSYASPKDVNKVVVDNYVDPSKNLVDNGGSSSGGGGGDISMTEASPRGSNKEGGGQSMYYYEMYPATPSAQQGQQAQVPPVQHASQGRQLCSYTETGVMRCQPKSASFYPTYEVAASNAIPQFNSGYYFRPDGDNRQGFDFGGDGGDDGQDLGGAGASGLAGLAGALGLLGLKGVKGMIALAPLALALPFLPLILPIILLPLLLPLLALLLFIPIPVVVTPGGRSVSGGIAEISERAWRMGTLIPEMAAEVLQSEECVERMSCEVARVSRSLRVGEGWIDGLTSSLPKENKYSKKILEGLKPEVKSSGKEASSSRKTSDDGGDCSVFACKAKPILAKFMTKI